MFATKCLSYKLASPTLADLTRDKKVLRYLKGTRELNLLPDDTCIETKRLEQDLETRHGIFWCWLGRWPSDSVLRWTISPDEWVSRTGTVALSSGESELYALGALSADLIFAQAILKRDWTIIPNTRESRQQHSTRSGNETRSESQDETHSHDILIHSRFGISETSNDVISQDWCESERHRNDCAGTWTIPQIDIDAWYGNRAERDEFSWQVVQWRRVTMRVTGYWYEGLDESNDRHKWASVDFVECSQCNEGRLANLTQPRDARRRALLNPCSVVAQLVTSQPVTEDTRQSDHEKIDRIIHCAQRTWTRFVLFPTLAKTAKQCAYASRMVGLHLSHRMITGPFVRSSKRTTNMLLHGSQSYGGNNAQSTMRRKRRGNTSLQIHIETSAQCSFRVLICVSCDMRHAACDRWRVRGVKSVK